MVFRKILYVVICATLVFGLTSCSQESDNVLNEGVTLPEETVIESIADIDIITIAQKEFMSEFKTELTANEVVDNMSDNLGKKFFLEGYVELADYYEYGFKELGSTHFVLRLESQDYGDWYLYCDKKSFQNISDSVEKNGKIMIWAICDIPKENYENGQGYMARLYATRHYQK